jgi:hypothetical protein
MPSHNDSPATIPLGIDHVPDLLSEVAHDGISLLSLVKRQCRSDDHEILKSRSNLLAKVRQLECALETPREIMIKHVWSQVRTTLCHNQLTLF